MEHTSDEKDQIFETYEELSKVFGSGRERSTKRELRELIVEKKLIFELDYEYLGNYSVHAIKLYSYPSLGNFSGSGRIHEGNIKVMIHNTSSTDKENSKIYSKNFGIEIIENTINPEFRLISNYIWYHLFTYMDVFDCVNYLESTIIENGKNLISSEFEKKYFGEEVIEYFESNKTNNKKVDILSDEYIFDCIMKIGKVCFDEIQKMINSGYRVHVTDYRFVNEVGYKGKTKQGFCIKLYEGFPVYLGTPFGSYLLGKETNKNWGDLGPIIQNRLGGKLINSYTTRIDREDIEIYSLNKIDGMILPEYLDFDEIEKEYTNQLSNIKNRWEKVSRI